MVPRLVSRPVCIVLIGICCGVSSCSSLVTRAMRPALGNLEQQTNIELVCAGTPAYLLMLDSMLVSSPENRELLLTGVQSFSAYATALEECAGGDNPQIAPIADKAKLYGQRLLAHYLPLSPGGNNGSLSKALAGLDESDVADVFWGTFGWLTWVKEQQGSPAAIADMVEIEKIMSRLLVLDESYQAGAIHLFFGTYYAARPALLGGRPDLSEFHFEKALQLADHRFLLTQTTYAETLARTTLDKELHDRLLNEVLAFPIAEAPEYGLSNQIAIHRARRLLQENYFD